MLPTALWDIYENILRSLGRNEALSAQWREHLPFLMELGFVNGDGALSETGRVYFRQRWVLGEIEAAAGQVKQALLGHPMTVLVCQVFHGRGKITRQQLDDLVCEQGLCAGKEAIGRFLSILNRFRIVSYSTKAGSFSGLEPVPPVASRGRASSVFLSPQTPFTNVQRFRELLGSARGEVIWLDKHFDRKAFPLIADCVDGERISAVTLVSSDVNCSPAARTEFSLLRDELAVKGVNLRWLVLRRSDMRDVHDRWLICDDWVYNLPPVNSLFGGQAADLMEIEDAAGRRSFALEIGSRGSEVSERPSAPVRPPGPLTSPAHPPPAPPPARARGRRRT